MSMNLMMNTAIRDDQFQKKEGKYVWKNTDSNQAVKFVEDEQAVEMEVTGSESYVQRDVDSDDEVDFNLNASLNRQSQSSNSTEKSNRRSRSRSRSLSQTKSGDSQFERSIDEDEGECSSPECKDLPEKIGYSTEKEQGNLGSRQSEQD